MWLVGGARMEHCACANWWVYCADEAHSAHRVVGKDVVGFRRVFLCRSVGRVSREFLTSWSRCECVTWAPDTLPSRSAGVSEIRGRNARNLFLVFSPQGKPCTTKLVQWIHHQLCNNSSDRLQLESPLLAKMGNSRPVDKTEVTLHTLMQHSLYIEDHTTYKM